jgi:hypothetical protein
MDAEKQELVSNRQLHRAAYGSYHREEENREQQEQSD